MTEQNRVIYDWLTFTTKIHSLPDVVSLLGLTNVKFENMRGRYCYQDRINYGGINIMYNGREDMGICVEMSGQGCRDFETYGNGDYQTIFDLITESWNADVDKREMNITRLDVAYDDYIGLLDLDYLNTDVYSEITTKPINKGGVNLKYTSDFRLKDNDERDPSAEIIKYLEEKEREYLAED